VQDPKLRKADRSAVDPKALFADLPMPPATALAGPYNILITGVGGTGVITIGALLGMAAHVQGLACSTLDFTGLSQKNGAVMSHVRLAPAPEMLTTVRIAPGNANLILGCDLVVATSVPALSRAERGVTRAVVNADLLPTASFVINPDLDFEAGAMRDALNGAVTAGDLDILDATGLATALTGDGIATNAFMLGFAFQRGAIPLSLDAILKAIELNGAAIEMNKMAFSWGRLAAHDLPRVVSAARFKGAGAAPVKRTLDETIALRAQILADYQDEAYARRYLADVERVRAAETAASTGSQELTEAFAKGLFKLMAYKDEYEVARLYSDGEFARALKEQFEGDSGLKVLLAPPLFARRDPVTGHLRKREFGPWVFRMFGLLARLKSLRGTTLDIFGYTAERKMERALPLDYAAMILRHLDGRTPLDLPRLVALAKAADLVRGYGHIKDANVARYRQECNRIEALLNQNLAEAAE
jgi:indolepyruvate ferredoxin oxidoreductase